MTDVAWLFLLFEIYMYIDKPSIHYSYAEFIEYPLNHNPDKKTYLVLDNARPYNNQKSKNFGIRIGND